MREGLGKVPGVHPIGRPGAERSDGGCTQVSEHRPMYLMRETAFPHQAAMESGGVALRQDRQAQLECQLVRVTRGRGLPGAVQ